MTTRQFQQAVTAAGGELHDDKPQTEAKCPKCEKRTATPHGDRDWWCWECGMAFSSEDDGDIGRGPPDRRLLREERRRESRRERKVRR